jgi:hypothetical protein
MSDINQYVNVMRKSGERIAAANPNSEYSQLKTELVEHYKLNKVKAEALITDVEANPNVARSAMHDLHYKAAIEAVRGVQQPILNTVQSSVPPPTISNREAELYKLQATGWTAL